MRTQTGTWKNTDNLKTTNRHRNQCHSRTHTSTPDKRAQFKGHDRFTWTRRAGARSAQREHTPTHSGSHLLTHSCHGRADRFLTRVFNSNHINPPPGTVSVSPTQALSQPLCCLGSVLVYRGSLRGRAWDEWMTARRPEMIPCSSDCPLQRRLLVCTKSHYCTRYRSGSCCFSGMYYEICSRSVAKTSSRATKHWTWTRETTVCPLLTINQRWFKDHSLTK